MTALAEALAAIEAAPAGPAIAAFFDFDGTLIDGYSAMAYFADRLRRGEMDRAEAADVLRTSLRGDLDEAAFAAAVERGLAPWIGRPEQDIVDVWQRLFRKRYGGRLFPGAWALVKAHQRRGHTVVIASSAMVYQVAPLAEELGIVDMLCTRPTVRDGRLTGTVERPTAWGSGKAAAVRAFAAARGLDLSCCHGYANGDEDVAFLQAVGHPAAINPGRKLAAVVGASGWPAVRFARRRTSALSKLRSVAAYGTLAAFVGTGKVYAALTGRRRQAAEVSCSMASTAMLGLTGIRVEVEGREHLRDHRPCVFMFNHQSHLDAYVLLTLLKDDFVGVSKIEMKRAPLLGSIMVALEFVFLDRRDRRSAVDTLRPVVDRIRAGRSLVIAPEGTRSLTSRLGPFKKGGFHVALQAGVPIVPLVLCDTWEVVPRDSVMFRPGTVHVRVLPPIDVSGWRVEDLDHHIAEVRQSYQRALDDYSSRRAAPARP